MSEQTKTDQAAGEKAGNGAGDAGKQTNQKPGGELEDAMLRRGAWRRHADASL